MTDTQLQRPSPDRQLPLTRRLPTVARRCLLTIGLFGFAIAAWAQRDPPSTDPPATAVESGSDVNAAAVPSAHSPVQKTEDSSEVAAGADLPGADGRFGVNIHRPTMAPQIATGLVKLDGTPMTVGCLNCHATRPPNPANRTVDDLDEFHGSMQLRHGNISCLSCHNSDDYSSLKLADGTRVEFPDVMELCSQCHGPQRTDYDHGLHGGMRGYWDSQRGGKQKNNCVDCHYPHAPQFPHMVPTFKPRDRFLESPHDDPHSNPGGA